MIIIVIIIMKLLSICYTYAVILTLSIKCVDKMNSASDTIFSNYKIENFIQYVHLLIITEIAGDNNDDTVCSILGNPTENL